MDDRTTSTRRREQHVAGLLGFVEQRLGGAREALRTLGGTSWDPSAHEPLWVSGRFTSRLHAALIDLDRDARERKQLRCLVHPALRTRIAASEVPWVRSLAVDASHAHTSVWRDLQGLIVLPAHPLGVDCLEAVGRLYRLIIATIRARSFPLRTPKSGALIDIPDAVIDLTDSGLEVKDQHLVLAGPLINRDALLPHRRHQRAGSSLRPQDGTDWDAVLRPLESMRQGLLACPAFPLEHGNLDAFIDHWDTTGFRASCPSCSTVWGIRTCDSCRQRYHFTMSQSDTAWEETVLTGGPADYFGMDLTAEPCSHQRGTFICLSCHRCPHRRDSPRCSACTSGSPST